MNASFFSSRTALLFFIFRNVFDIWLVRCHATDKWATRDTRFFISHFRLLISFIIYVRNSSFRFLFFRLYDLWNPKIKTIIWVYENHSTRIRWYTFKPISTDSLCKSYCYNLLPNVPVSNIVYEHYFFIMWNVLDNRFCR